MCLFVKCVVNSNIIRVFPFYPWSFNNWFQKIIHRSFAISEKNRNFATKKNSNIGSITSDITVKSGVQLHKLNNMIKRYLQILNELESSIFLFGARQTGKSTILSEQLKGAAFFDLLDGETRRRLQSRPELLFNTLKDKEEGSIVVIDEISEVPELLNEVHRLISQKKMRFVLCGSSARKLKRKGYNTLGGRAFPCFFYPFVSAELPEFDLDKALTHGLLPPHYLSKNPRRLLASYIDVYLREEIMQEAIIRKSDVFSHFLDVAALTSGEIVNYNNIASDCGVSAKTIKEYFSILEDTLVGYMIPPFSRVQKRKVLQAPKFYFFDVGIYNYLMHRQTITHGTPEYGHALEHFVVQEIIAKLGYSHSRETLSYWHTYGGSEVDLVIGDARLAIEIKSTYEIQNRHLTGLKSFGKEFANCRLIAISLDKFTRKMGNVECFYIEDFLKTLWNGGFDMPLTTI